MKKLFLCAALVLAAVAGTVCYNTESRNENEMSDLAKANVKALAEEEENNKPLGIVCFKNEKGNAFLCKCSNCAWGYVSGKKDGKCYGE